MEGTPSRDAWTAAQCAVARTLFSVCGRTASERGDAVTRRTLASLAGQFAWHADLLFDLLPERDGVDRDELLVAAREATSDVQDALERAACDASLLCSALRLLVLPSIAAEVRHVRTSTDARLDGPRARSLTLIVRDLDDAMVRLDALGADDDGTPAALEDVASLLAGWQARAGRGT